MQAMTAGRHSATAAVRPRSVAAALLGAALALTGVTGCSSSTVGGPSASVTAGGPSARPTGSSSSTGSGGVSVTAQGLPSCGEVPSSSGPAANLAKLSLKAPEIAASGATVPVTVTLRVLSDGIRIITTAAASDVLIVQDGRVVGRSAALRPHLAVPLQLRRGADRPAQVVPDTVRLAGCPAGSGADDAKRPALPRGRYSLVAVLGYGTDALNNAVDGPTASSSGVAGQRGFELVSDPVPVTVG